MLLRHVALAQDPSGYPVDDEGNSVMDAELDFIILVKGCCGAC